MEGDAPVQEVKDGTKSDTCRSPECNHRQAGIAALVPFSFFLISNIKFKTLTQHWRNAAQRCRTIITEAPAWIGVTPSREDIAVHPTRRLAGSQKQHGFHKKQLKWRSVIAAASCPVEEAVHTFGKWFKYSGACSLRDCLCLALRLYGLLLIRIRH